MSERILRGKVDVVLAGKEQGREALSPCGDGCNKEPKSCGEIIHAPRENAALCGRLGQIIFVKE